MLSKPGAFSATCSSLEAVHFPLGFPGWSWQAPSPHPPGPGKAKNTAEAMKGNEIGKDP